MSVSSDTGDLLHRERSFGGGHAERRVRDSAPMCVAMTSVQRDNENYAEGTIANLLNVLPSTALPIHVVVGGTELTYLSRLSHMDSIVIHPWIAAAERVRRNASMHYAASVNYARALGVWSAQCNDTAARAQRRGLLVVEDDIVLNNDFHERLVEAIDEIGDTHEAYWLDCYTPSALDCRAAGAAMPHVGKYDAQCCPLCRYYSPKAVEMLRGALIENAMANRYAPKKMLPHDTIAVMFARGRISMLCVFPRDIAQHIGRISSGLDSMNTERASKTFVHSPTSIRSREVSMLPDLAHLLVFDQH